MAEKRQLELYLLRFLPHALRDDFVTVGLLLVESDGGFAEVRFTRDWRMLQCVAPDVELEWFEMVESEIRGRLGSLRRREELILLMSERFGTMIDVAPTKAVTIGSERTADLFFTGQIDDVKVWRPSPHKADDDFIRRVVKANLTDCWAEWGRRLRDALDELGTESRSRV